LAPHDIGELKAQLAAVIKRLDEQDRKYDARREEDDAREARAQKERQELIARVDRHGVRTTAIETKWEAFFSEQGAFRLFCAQIAGHDKKIDKLMWIAGIGFGIVVTLQFVLKH